MKKTLRKIVAFMLSAIILVCNFAVFSSATEVQYAFDDNGIMFKFGSYPTLIVEDQSDIDALNSLAAEAEWESYDYISGTSTFRDADSNLVVTTENAESSDFMKYMDVQFEGKKYRGVRFDDYRPCFTSLKNQFSAISGYYSSASACPVEQSAVLWFEYTELLWTLVEGGSGLSMCLDIIDAQPYANFITKTVEGYVNESGMAANDWETSSIRSWLNNEFLNTAFAPETRDALLVNEDNDYVSLIYADDFEANTDVIRSNRLTNYAQSQCNGNEPFAFWVKSNESNGTTFAASYVITETQTVVRGDEEDVFCAPVNAIAGICPVIRIDTVKFVAYQAEASQPANSEKPIEYAGSESSQTVNGNPGAGIYSEITVIDEDEVGTPYEGNSQGVRMTTGNQHRANSHGERKVVSLADLLGEFLKALFKLVRAN